MYSQSVAEATDAPSLVQATKDYLEGPSSGRLNEGGIILSLQTMDGAVISNSGDVRLEELPGGQSLLNEGERVLADVETTAGRYRRAGTPVLLAGTRVAGVLVAVSLSGLDTLCATSCSCSSWVGWQGRRWWVWARGSWWEGRWSRSGGSRGPRPPSRERTSPAASTTRAA